MKLTLLQLVQDMLAAIDADNISAVTDTAESNMCVQIANRAYEEMMSMHRWKHLRQYSALVNNTNNTLKTPAGTYAIDPNSIWYGDNGEEQMVIWMPPDQFLGFTIARNTDDPNVVLQGRVKAFNDRNPQFFTSDDDETLVFDSFNGTPLDGNKASALLYILPGSRVLADSAQFDLPAVAFPALSALCISKALGELKGDTQQAQLEFRNYMRLVSSLSRNARLIDVLNDRRKNIVPRRMTGNRLSRIP